MKENIRNLDTAPLFEKVISLQPRIYDLKEPGFGKDINGFIAHEVQDIIPEMVIGEKDAVDENGDPVMQNLANIPSIYLISSIQELNKTIQKLEERLAVLESK